MKRIYVAGPYTHGDVAVNVGNAMDVADMIIRAGHAPFVPHLFHFMHIQSPNGYGTWTAIDNAFVQVCDALYRMPGISPGADAEVKLAEQLNIPCFDVFEELLERMK